MPSPLYGTPEWAWRNAIQEYGIEAACEWFGYAPDSDFTKDTVRLFKDNPAEKDDSLTAAYMLGFKEGKKIEHPVNKRLLNSLKAMLLNFESQHALLLQLGAPDFVSLQKEASAAIAEAESYSR